MALSSGIRKVRGANRAGIGFVLSVAPEGQGTANTPGGVSKGIEFHERVFSEMIDQVEAMQDALTNLVAGRQIQRHIARLAGAAVTRNFKRQQGPRKTSWRGLAESTQKDRSRWGFDPNRPILFRSGTLFTAATQGLATIPFGQSVLQIQPARFEVNPYDPRGITPEAYFDTHNLGGDTPWGGSVDRRSFFWINTKDAVIIADMMAATVIGEATRVARMKRNHPIVSRFKFRMAELGLDERDFLNSGLVDKAAAASVRRIKRGLD